MLAYTANTVASGSHPSRRYSPTSTGTLSSSDSNGHTRTATLKLPLKVAIYALMTDPIIEKGTTRTAHCLSLKTKHPHGPISFFSFLTSTRP